MAMGTITRSYTRVLHNAFTHTTTSKHLCHRLNIGKSTLKSIAWDEFSRAFRSLSPSHKSTVRKWIFGYLPTQRRLAKYNNCQSATCPQCQQQDETDLHFLICGGSESWQDCLIQPIQRICHQHKPHPVFESLLVTQVQRFLNGEPNETTPQSELGWQAAFAGFLSQDWIPLTRNTQGSTTLTKIIKIILSAIAVRWKQRCHLTESRRRVQHQIRTLYGCKDLVLQQDQQIFSTPLHEILQCPTYTLKAFISQFKPIIKQSIQMQSKQTKRQHRDIATYFIRNPRTRVTLRQ